MDSHSVKSYSGQIQFEAKEGPSKVPVMSNYGENTELQEGSTGVNVKFHDPLGLSQSL